MMKRRRNMDLNNQSYLYHEDPAYGVSSISPLSQIKIIKDEEILPIKAEILDFSQRLNKLAEQVGQISVKSLINELKDFVEDIHSYSVIIQKELRKPIKTVTHENMKRKYGFK